MKKWKELNKAQKAGRIAGMTSLCAIAIASIILIGEIIAMTIGYTHAKQKRVTASAQTNTIIYLTGEFGYNTQITVNNGTYRLYQITEGTYSGLYAYNTNPQDPTDEQSMLTAGTLELGDIATEEADSYISYPIGTGFTLREGTRFEGMSEQIAPRATTARILINYSPTDKGATYQEGYNAGFNNGEASASNQKLYNENSTMRYGAEQFQNAQFIPYANGIVSLNLQGFTTAEGAGGVQLWFADTDEIIQYPYGGQLTVTWTNNTVTQDQTLYIYFGGATQDRQSVTIREKSGTITINSPQATGGFQYLQVAPQAGGNFQATDLTFSYRMGNYAEGLNQGFENGYREGEENGYNNGYEAGYAQGITDAEGFSLSWLANFANALFDIKVFGTFTLGNFVFTLIAIAVFGGLLKLFFGG